MTVWGNRYSALFQESSAVKYSPTLSPEAPDPFSANQAQKHTLIRSEMPHQRFSPRSSVFVACLPTTIPPHEMQQKLGGLISQFVTPLNVKIINDRLGNKAAFVQTKSNEDATLLINSQICLDGKILRLELARAHRTLVLSFTDVQLPPPKLRLIRNFEGFLRVIDNESAPVENWTQPHPEDQFSGSGYLLPYFSYSESSLRELCELLGPLEEFKLVDLDNPPATECRADFQDPKAWLPHVMPSQGSNAQSGLWEVKWQTREDAMQARSILAKLPFITWTWLHTMTQTDAHNRHDHKTIRPHHGASHFERVRFASSTSPFQHGLEMKPPHDPIILSGKDPRASTGRSLGLDIEEFPPLTNGQHRPTFEKIRRTHERTVSVDTENPTTPDSLHHPSLEIANISGGDYGDTLNHTLRARFDKPPSPVLAIHAASFDGAGVNYDRSTLYIAGIPKNAKENQLKELFDHYGEIKNVQIFRGHRSELTSAFVAFSTTQSAANAMAATNGTRPVIVGTAKLRVRYKRLQTQHRYARRGRFPAQSPVQPAIGHQPRHDDQQKEEEIKQEQTSDGLDESSDGKKGEENNMSSGEEQAPSSVDIESKDNSDKVHDSGEASVLAISSNANGPNSTESSPRQTSEAPDSQIFNEAPTPVVETPAILNDNLLPKPSYYGYYAPQYPTSYQPWGYPYPMYASVYPYQGYGHPYWYPPGVMPVPPPAYASPRTPANKMDGDHIETSPSPPYGPLGYPNFAPAKPPVAPAASYQNPDGGITYVYPAEVIEKYMSGPKTRHNDTSASRGGAERPQHNNPQSTQPYDSPGKYYYGTPNSVASFPSPIRFQNHQEARDSNVAHDVHPSIAAAVYRNYTPLPPPPVDKMPQGSFIFNSQGVVQHVEPGGHLQGHAGGALENGLGIGMGLVQAAAAVVANGYHPLAYPNPTELSLRNQEGGSDVQSTSSRYPSPIPAPGPYYYPQNIYHPAFAQMGSGTDAHPQYSTNSISNGRGGYKRRANDMPRAAYPVATGGDPVGGVHSNGVQGI